MKPEIVPLMQPHEGDMADLDPWVDSQSTPVGLRTGPKRLHDDDAVPSGNRLAEQEQIPCRLVDYPDTARGSGQPGTYQRRSYSDGADGWRLCSEAPSYRSAAKPRDKDG
jgi:hypothetical protein